MYCNCNGLLRGRRAVKKKGVTKATTRRIPPQANKKLRYIIMDLDKVSSRVYYLSEN